MTRHSRYMRCGCRRGWFRCCRNAGSPPPSMKLADAGFLAPLAIPNPGELSENALEPESFCCARMARLLKNGWKELSPSPSLRFRRTRQAREDRLKLNFSATKL